MGSLLTTLLWIGSIIVGASLIYCIIAYVRSNRNSVIETSVKTKDNFLTTSYYYLPVGMVKLIALLKVKIHRDATSSAFIRAVPSDLVITPSVQILPDNSRLFLLKHKENSFANDDLKITTTDTGLLENIGITVEDRIISTVSSLFNAPALILSAPEVKAAGVVPSAEIIEIQEHSREFYIMPGEPKPEQSIDFKWLIDIVENNVVVKQVDASFKITISTMPSIADTGNKFPSIPDENFTTSSIVVRPVITLKLDVTPVGAEFPDNLSTNISTITVPDISQYLVIPITRSLLVKKTQSLKFQNGLLLENSINTPSTSEAFVSLPINFLKAIFSIPSQLFTFRINHLKGQSLLNAEEANFIKAQVDARKNQITSENELLKAKLDMQKALAASEQDLLKAKLDNDKKMIDAQKDILVSQKDLIKAQQDLIKAQKEQEEARKNGIRAQQ